MQEPFPTEDINDHLRTIKNVLLVFLGILFAYLMKELSALLIPLTLALFISILLYPVLSFFEEKNVPYFLSLAFILVVAFYFFNTVGGLIFQTATQIIADQDRLMAQVYDRFAPILEFAKTNMKIDIDELSQNLGQTAVDYFSLGKILSSSGTFAGLLKSLTSTLFMGTLYLIVILGGILRYDRYLDYLEQAQPEEGGKLTQAFEQIKNSITTYVKVKFLISISTGLFYWVICLIFNIDFAPFWGFLAFLLNFIPTFGSIIATVPVLVLGWIQIPALTVFVVFAIALVAVQITLGNIVDPMLMGASLSINTVFVLLGLVVWTYLWGVVGTLLSVPLLVLLKVVLQQIPDAQFLVRMMGSSKEIEDFEKSR